MQSKCAIYAVAVVAGILANTGRSNAAEQPPVDERFAKLLAQYKVPQTLHCKVAVSTDYKTVPPGIFHVDGTQEYWVDGPKYRIVQSMDSVVYPGMSHDVRWDGEQFQWLNMADSTLIVSKHPRQKTPYISEPFPLLPLSFLNPGGDELGVRLSLDELRGDDMRTRLAGAKVDQRAASSAVIPGGKIGDMETTYRINFGGSPFYLPTAITRLSQDGVALSTDEIKYQPVPCDKGVVYLPSSATLTNRTTDNRVDIVTTYKVTALDVDVAIPAEIFTIDFQTAKSVINVDTFGRSKSLNNSGIERSAGTPKAEAKNYENLAGSTAIPSGESASITAIADAPSQPTGNWLATIFVTMLFGALILFARSAGLTFRRVFGNGGQR